MRDVALEQGGGAGANGPELARLPLGGPDGTGDGSCQRCGSSIPAGRNESNYGTPARYCSGECRALAQAGRARARREQRYGDLRARFIAAGRRVNCDKCGNPIEDSRLRCQAGRTRFCAACDPKRQPRQRQKRKGMPAFVNEPAPRLVPSALGAMNELAVAADLMRRGYEVFRALSPASPCDLLALKGSLLMRVEVRSVTRDADGSLRKVISKRDHGRYDVAALVERSGQIHYRGLSDA